MKNHRDDTLQEACQWLARLNAQDCSEQERQSCRVWQASSAENARAFAAASTMFTGMAAHGRTDPYLLELAEEAFAMGSSDETGADRAEVLAFTAPAGPKLQVSKRRQVLALAASLAVVVPLLFIALESQVQQGAEYISNHDVREVELEDGTRVMMDADTSMRFEMGASARTVYLDRGRAFFDVAHNPDAPFSVHAGVGEVLAVGTRFQVAQNGQSLDVVLESGIVDVFGHYRSGLQQTRLQPGEQLIFSEDAQLEWVRNVVDTSVETSWMHGRLVFRNIPLSSALESINRYAETKVRLGDPMLAELKVSGNFVRGDSKLAVSAFTAAFPLRATEIGNEIILFSGYSDN